MPRFDTAAMLAEIRSWAEIESPTTEAAAVNRMVDAATLPGAYAAPRFGTDLYRRHVCDRGIHP